MILIPLIISSLTFMAAIAWMMKGEFPIDDAWQFIIPGALAAVPWGIVWFGWSVFVWWRGC